MRERTHRIPPQQLERARALRQRSTLPETLLWSRLRDRRCQGLKFRRQVAIESFIADFYCAAAKLVVELDGDTHEHQRDYDAQRTLRLAELGLQVARYTNDDVLDDVDAVAAGIGQLALRRISELNAR
jgi:very-short-patch-repair endonuclease